MKNNEIKKIKSSTLYGIYEKDLRYIGIIEVLDSLVEKIVCTKSVSDIKTYVDLFIEVYLLYLKGGENNDN